MKTLLLLACAVLAFAFGDFSSARARAAATAGTVWVREAVAERAMRRERSGWPGRAAWVRRNTGDFYITFPAVAGRWYRVEESNDLITWTPLYDLGVWPTSEPINLSSNSTGPRYFLRVRVGP